MFEWPSSLAIVVALHPASPRRVAKAKVPVTTTLPNCHRTPPFRRLQPQQRFPKWYLSTCLLTITGLWALSIQLSPQNQTAADGRLFDKGYVPATSSRRACLLRSGGMPPLVFPEGAPEHRVP